MGYVTYILATFLAKISTINVFLFIAYPIWTHNSDSALHVNSKLNLELQDWKQPNPGESTYILEQVRLVFIVEVNVVKPKDRWRQTWGFGESEVNLDN